MKKEILIFTLCLCIFIAGCLGVRYLHKENKINPLSGKVYEANHFELNVQIANAGLDMNGIDITLADGTKIKAERIIETPDPNSAEAEAELVTAIGDIIIPCLLKNNVIEANEANDVKTVLLKAVE